MIEVSVMEIALLVLCAIGWAGFFYEKEQHRLAKRFITALLDDDELRGNIVRDYKEFQARAERSS